MAGKIVTFHGKTISGPSGTGIVMINEPEPAQSVNIDGRAYRTVTIGNQEWMAENLDFKFDGLTFRDGTTGNELTDDTTTAQAAYYDYDEATYGIAGNKCGLLYNWIAVNYLNTHLSGLAVPAGWHVPTCAEWSTLISTAGDNPGWKLKAVNSFAYDTWSTDDYQFSAVPTGYWNNGFSSSATSQTNFWTSESGGNTSYERTFDSGPMVPENSSFKYICYPVRLVKDSTSA